MTCFMLLTAVADGVHGIARLLAKNYDVTKDCILKSLYYLNRV